VAGQVLSAEAMKENDGETRKSGKFVSRNCGLARKKTFLYDRLVPGTACLPCAQLKSFFVARTGEGVFRLSRIHH
jgi:hypothetical protein